jgi:hypothetical protein
VARRRWRPLHCRPSIALIVSTELAVDEGNRMQGLNRDGSVAWTSPTDPGGFDVLCFRKPPGFRAATGVGDGYTGGFGYNIYDLSNGAVVGSTAAANDFVFSIFDGPDVVNVGGGFSARTIFRSTATTGARVWTNDTLPEKTVEAPALDVGGDLVVARTGASASALYRLDRTTGAQLGTESALALVTAPPVVRADDVAILGTTAGVAAVGADGTLLNLLEVAGEPRDVLIATDDLVFVATTSSVHTLRFRGGVFTLVHTLVGVPGGEMLLRDHVLFVARGDGLLKAHAVAPAGYDTTAPWPVRFHDNQRTCDRIGSLAF